MSGSCSNHFDFNLYYQDQVVQIDNFQNLQKVLSVIFLLKNY